MGNNEEKKQQSQVLENEATGGVPRYELPEPVLYAIDILIQGVNIAQEKGAYTLGDAGRICEAINAVRPFLPIAGERN